MYLQLVKFHFAIFLSMPATAYCYTTNLTPHTERLKYCAPTTLLTECYEMVFNENFYISNKIYKCKFQLQSISF